MRQIPNLIDGNEIEFGRDPNRIGITRMFDDFLGGANNTQISSQFHAFGSTSGGVWNTSQSFDTLDPTGFDDFGTIQAETSTGTTARSILHLAQLMKASPTAGDRWMWEVRVKPQLKTGNGFWSMSIVRTNTSDGYFQLKGAPIGNDAPRMSVFAKFDEAKWQTHRSDNTASVTGTTAATSVDYQDDTYVRIAVMTEFLGFAGYRNKFYINGTEVFNNTLAFGSGSPYGKCFLYNNGTDKVQRATYDWSLIQFTRTDAVDYIDIDTV